MMQTVNTWEGFNQGTKTLADAATSYDTRRRQAIQDEMVKQDWEWKVGERERKLADEAQVRGALKDAATPIETTTQEANPEYQKYLDAHSPEALQEAQRSPQIPVDQGMTDLEGLAGVKYSGQPVSQKGLADLAVANGTVPQQTLSKTTSTVPSHFKMQIDAGKALLAQGNPAGQKMLEEGHKAVMDEAKNFIAMGDGEAAIKLMNTNLGTNLEYMGEKDDLVTAKGQNGTFMYNKRFMSRDIRSGMTLEEAYKRNAVQIDDKSINEWDNLPRETINGVTVIPQKNKLTGETKYTQVSRVPQPAGGAGGKDGTDAIPVPVAKMLEPAQKTASTSQRLSTTFDQTYTVAKVPKSLGDGIIAIKKQYGEDSEAANWWTDYQGYKNQVRNELFGSALTDTEAREFDKANINPGMSAAQIKKNLARQQEISVAAYERLRSGQLPSKKFGATVAEVYPSLAKPSASGAPTPRAGYKIQSKTVNGKTIYREVPK